MQIIDQAVLTKEPKIDLLVFENKRPIDFWKRLKNIEPLDAMRAKKENSGLGGKIFIWVVTKVPVQKKAVDHIEMMLMHCFGGNIVHGQGNMKFYIG